MWLLPTRGRLDNLKRFFNAAREAGTSTPGMVLISRSDWDANEDAYRGLIPLAAHLKGWQYHVVEAETLADTVEAGWALIKDKAPWVGLLSDSHVPMTSNWDVMMLKRLNGWNFVCANDLWLAPGHLFCAMVFSADLVRAVGWLFPPGSKQHFFREAWAKLGHETETCHWRVEVTVRATENGDRREHLPPTGDAVPHWDADKEVFEAWLRDDADRALAAIRSVQQRYDVRKVEVNIKGRRIMIAVPCGSGRYETRFVRSLYETFNYFSVQQAPFQWAEEKYTADIAYARASLFSAFIRSDCTDLLMIDDDMGWDIQAIMRLFAAKKDFVAIAGPKKRYPLTFAANYSDDAGNPLPLAYDPESMTMEVTEVGAAFVLISRRCAEMMTRAYSDLLYFDAGGEPAWAVFTPMVEHKRYFSEDFAFCRRWRRLGGTVHIVPDVPLSHTGAHTFEGAFSDLWQQPPPVRTETVVELPEAAD